MTDPQPNRRTVWGAALGLQISGAALRRARLKAGVLAAAIVAVILVFEHRFALAGERSSDHQATLHILDAPVRILTVVVLVGLGWTFARDVGRAVGPALLAHMDPAAAGTVGFLIRLVTIATTVIVAAGFAGVDLRALVVGGAFTAVIVGLAAQQTLGNLIAGTVLLTARPFRVGERVRLQGAPGRIEGLVSTLGLLYTTFADGDDRILVPNSVVLASALTPLREPDAVQLRARLRAGTKPADLESLIEAALTTPIRAHPSITLVELDGDEVIVQIAATPMRTEDAGQLASELLEIVAAETPQAAEEAAAAEQAEAAEQVGAAEEAEAAE
jgi:small conductance mechanosensitive channel